MSKKNKNAPQAEPKPVRRPAPSAAPAAGWRPTRGLWLVLILAFAMRFLDLGAKSLWVDEIFDWNLVIGPWKPIFQTVHPTAYVLEKFAFNFGRSEFMLRLPSALFGIIGVLFMYLTGRMLRGERLGVIAGLAFCVSPIFVYYTQDSHYYGIMMGLAAVVMFGACWMTQRDSWLGVALTLAASYLTYKTHLAAIFVPLAAAATIGVWILFDRTLLDQALGWFREKGKESPAILWGAAVGVAGGAGFVFYRLARLAVMTLSEDSDSDIDTTPNFALNWSFFSKLIRDYLGGFSDYSSLNLGISLLAAALALAGLAILARRRHWLAFYLPMIFIAPWIALSIHASDHFFHLRYTSFIVPGLILLACVALDAAAELAEKSRPGKGYWVACGAAGIVWGLAVVPNLGRYYAGQKQDWRGAAEWLSRNAEPDSRVATLLYCNYSSLDFYKRVLPKGGREYEIFKLYEKTGGSQMPLAQLKSLCLQGKPIYITSSYQRYEPKGLYDWVRAHSDRVFDAPTLHPDEFNREGKNVEIYKFRHSGRFLRPPTPMEIAIEGEPSEWSQEILVDRAHRAHIQVQWANDTDAPASAALIASGKELKRWSAAPHVRGAADFVADLPEGPVDFQLLMQGSGTVRFQRIRFETSFAEPFRIPALEASTYFPSYYNKESQDGGRPVLAMQRNSFMAYEVFLEPGLDRYISIRAKNDAPSPIILEVAVDGEGLGFLGFEKGDGSWSTQGLPFRAAEGKHRIDLSFVNEGDVDKDLPPDEDRDAIVDWIEISGLPQPGKRDDRAPMEDVLVLDPEFAKRFDWSGEHIPPGWFSTDPDRLEFVDDPETGKGRIAKIICPPKRRGEAHGAPPDPALDAFFLNPAPLDVRKGELVYFSTYVRTDNLRNHSVNILLTWLNEKGEIVKKSTIYRQGLTDAQFWFQDLGWMRLVAVRPAPPGAVSVSVSLWVYPNGRLPDPKPGYIYVRPFRFHAGG